MKSMPAVLNSVLTLRQWMPVHNVLYLCQDRETCHWLERVGLYHWYPADLIASAQSSGLANLSPQSPYFFTVQWVRAGFNDWMLQNGIHFVCLDGDTVFRRNPPLEILFNSSTDISMEYSTSKADSSWCFQLSYHSELFSHCHLSPNIGIARIRSSRATRHLMQLVRHRMKWEMRQTELWAFTQTAFSFVLRTENLTFDRSIWHGTSYLTTATPPLSLLLFKTCWVSCMSTCFMAHASGMHGANKATHGRPRFRSSWDRKISVLRRELWLLSPEWQAHNGSRDFYTSVRNASHLCIPSSAEERVDPSDCTTLMPTTYHA
eukprot:NODE_2773_length_1094_cov_19.586350_g2647_i0.p1 GENE.NODE_2773_length_1094_cov_19.586350_g2647_i0~~NODE_2773_length_1094_cov_19.586350_g2647_i0.p1  ORF type:complete len:356 (+),score=51.64 NODE_2773_length_1094_cov_19.586350_g2647_i0:114-1070(+)